MMLASGSVTARLRHQGTGAAVGARWLACAVLSAASAGPQPLIWIVRDKSAWGRGVDQLLVHELVDAVRA